MTEAQESKIKKRKIRDTESEQQYNREGIDSTSSKSPMISLRSLNHSTPLRLISVSLYRLQNSGMEANITHARSQYSE